MSHEQQTVSGTVWLGAVIVLFGLLLLATQGNELLKQLVLVPGSAAEIGVAANCRADELEEENLSLRECQLMVSSVQITLASSLGWFRPFQLGLSMIACIGATASLLVGFALVNAKANANRWGCSVFPYSCSWMSSGLSLRSISGRYCAHNISRRYYSGFLFTCAY